jgi:hypothetical protein
MVSMCKLPLKVGSDESLNMHRELKAADGDEPGDHFKSILIQRYLDYKWTNVKSLGIANTLLYCLYLLCLILIPHWVVLTFWLIIHLAIEIYQFKQS